MDNFEKRHDYVTFLWLWWLEEGKEERRHKREMEIGALNDVSESRRFYILSKLVNYLALYHCAFLQEHAIPAKLLPYAPRRFTIFSPSPWSSFGLST